MHVTLVTRHDLLPAVHGAAVKVVRTAEAISRLGVQVTIVTGDREHYHLYEDGNHSVIPYAPRWIAATRVPRRLRPLLERLGVPDYWRTVEGLLDSLGYPRDEHILYQPLVDPEFWLRTLYVGIRHRTDWFQAEFPGFGAPAWVAARILRRKCSIVQHNVEWKRLADTTELPQETIDRLRGIELQLCHLADEVITCSDDDRTLMLPDDFERDEITVIPHGVERSMFVGKTGAGVRDHYGIPRENALLFFHGTLHYWPNTVACRIFAEEILPRLEQRGRKVSLLVAGMGAPDRYSHPNLTYAGCVEDLATHIAAAEVCVVPLMDGGGTRLKILEYFGAGKAVISTKKGAEGLLLQDGYDVFLTEDGDWDTFCDRIEELLDHPERATAMGHNARQFSDRYDWDRVGEAFLQLYEGREQVRGTDFNAVFSSEVERAAGGLDAVLPDIVAVQKQAHDLVLRKERRGNASALLNDGKVPEVVHWDDDAVTHELSEEDITRHIPVDIDWQKPRTMILLLNKRCNLKCDFCDLWHFTDMMPFESAITVISRAPAAGVKTLVITGGEPFVHPRIFAIIEYAKNLGLGVNITTNGTLLRRDMQALKNSRVDSLSISIDGFEDTHDQLRGVDGAYEETMAAISELQDSTDIHLNIYFVVTNQNVQDLVPIHDFAQDRGIGFDFWPVNGYPHLYVTEGEHKQTYLAAVEEIGTRNREVAERMDYYRYGIEYMEGRRDHVRCLGLLEQFGVNHEGKLVPCCVWDQKNLQVGSALDEPLDQLFYSQRAQDMREEVFNTGCLDQCFNHSLYEFSQATSLPFVVQEATREVGDDALIKESGQAREAEAKARRRAAAKARRAKEHADKEASS